MDRTENSATSLSNSKARRVGSTVVSEILQIDMDNFWFLIDKDAPCGLYDFISVEDGPAKGIVTVGIVNNLCVIPHEEDYSLRRTESQKEVKKALRHQDTTEDQSPLSLTTANTSKSFRTYLSKTGLTVAKATVLAIIDKRSEEHNVEREWAENSSPLMDMEKLADMPVMPGRPVRFATFTEVVHALGTPKMGTPIPAGIIEMSDNTNIPVSLDISYIAGPDTAHVNAAGISGNLKTTYLLFLLHSAYQTLMKRQIKKNMSQGGSGKPAIILFNTKDDDLLHVDQPEDDLSEHDQSLYKIMGLEMEPFRDVTYFLPRGNDGRPNSVVIPKNSRTYSFELEDIFDSLELLFAETLDPHYDSIYSIVSYISEAWPLVDRSNQAVKTWSDLAGFAEYPPEIVSHRSSFLHFMTYLQKFRRSPLFIDERKTSIYLGRAIRQMTAGEVYVIDLARIPTLEEQAFVVGDVMRSIDDMYSAARFNPEARDAEKNYDSPAGSQAAANSDVVSLSPDYLFIFIDEINRFLPKSKVPGRASAVADQIMRTVVAGRSRNTILFSAQQFKSTVDISLIENTGTHTLAKLGLSELSTPAYSMIDDVVKKNIVRLRKGEMVLVHPAFRHPVRMTFPRAAFKRP